MEHPFRVIKRQFGFVKVRHKGLAKNAAQIYPCPLRELSARLLRRLFLERPRRVSLF
jgi:hypothetical protein